MDQYVTCLIQAPATVASDLPLNTTDKPNILFIVADDCFSDTSPYGGEIYTPNLAKLAARMQMTNFRTSATALQLVVC